MIMTSQEAADYLRISEGTLRRSRSTGYLFGFPTPPYRKLGHIVRYRKPDIDAWMALTTEGTSADVQICGYGR
jgi:predicted DNA-binding transcriptional regulator AlpA